MQLFQRQWRIRLDTIETSDLAVAFEVDKTLKAEPNKCTVSIWNLTPDHRAHLERLSTNKKKGKGNIRVEIEAGYKDNTSLIFRGDLRNAKSTRDGADIVTQLEGEDGGRTVMLSRVQRSFPPGTPVKTVVEACAESLGIGNGNLSQVPISGKFPEGTVLSGVASDELARVLRSYGYTYSIQNGVLQVLQRGKALQTTGYLLTDSTGLIAAPVPNFDGGIEVQTMLIPDLYPGRRIMVDSTYFKGQLRINACKYTGSSHGDEWSILMQCKAL